MRKTIMKYFASAMAITTVLSLSGCSLDSDSDLDLDTEVQDSISTVSEALSYDEKLFDTSYVHKINIEIPKEDWEDLKANPTQKTKYEVDITIDGETIENVSFATKGNTSLTSVASDTDSDRYSFKVNFGKYVDGQTYYGLDKLNLNNIYADATYMKDYISYFIFNEAGVESPLVSYVYIQINGEDFGLYLAIEDVSDSYLARTAEGDGELYKPETAQLANMGEAGGGMEKPAEGEMPEGMEKPAEGEIPEGMEKPAEGEMPEEMEKPAEGEMPEGMEKPDGAQMPNGNNMMSNSNGASLKYTDDEISSYSDIFDNGETDSEEEDWNRVIKALKNLSEGKEEDAIDTEKVIRYFVAHNFVLNYDSYTGNMLHNYYLYENNGLLSLLPWDYNLSFGAFSEAGGAEADATALINTGIDTPLSGVTEDDRPFWSFITENEEYLELYHTIYKELIGNFFESGKFETELERVYNMIRPYVEKDPSAFYTTKEFDSAYDTLKNFCLLRAVSIQRQLNGELSTFSSEQNTENQVDGSGINIKNMGMQNNKQRSGDMQNPNGNAQKPQE